MAIVVVVVSGCSPVWQVISPPVIEPEPIVSIPITPVIPEPVIEQPIEQGPIEEEPSAEPFETQKYSFWFSRNSTHTQPSLGIQKKYIEKYGTIALGQNTGRYIYLTFDEGYELGFTPQVLDVLQDLNVPAAFFVTGHYVSSQPDLVRRMAAEGHIVGNHTMTHPSLADISEDILRQEFLDLDELLEPLIGERTYFMRPPMGQYSELSLAVASQLGYRTTFWSMAYRDWYVDNQLGADYAYEHVVSNIHSGAVILLHAVSQSNAEALQDIIVELKMQGYEFRSLNDFR